VTLFETLGRVLPRSLFTHLGEQTLTLGVPARVATLIRTREEESERVIGWVQARDGGALCNNLPSAGPHLGRSTSNMRNPISFRACCAF
jgi:hypothetical protein